MSHNNLRLLHRMIGWFILCGGLLQTSVDAASGSGDAASGSVGAAPRRASSRLASMLDPVEYVDTTFGFAVRPPIGSVPAGTQLYDPRDANVVLVAFRGSPHPVGELVVQLWSWLEPKTPDEIANGLRAFLILEQPPELPPSFSEENAKVTVAGKTACRFTAKFTLAERHTAKLTLPERHLYRLYGIVPLNQRMSLAFIYTDDYDRRAAARPLFDDVLESIRLLDQRAGLGGLRKALDRGAVLTTELREADLVPVLVDHQWFLLEGRAGGVVGYLHVRESAGRKAGAGGVWIKEDGFVKLASRRREGGGNAEAIGLQRNQGQAIVPLDNLRIMRNRFFVSDRQFRESWTQEVRWISGTSETERAGDEAMAVRDYLQGERVGLGDEEGRLVVAYTPGPGAPELTDAPVLKVPPYYISEATVRLLPRLIGIDKPLTYAFASFARSRNGLTTRIYRIVGPEQITINRVEWDAVRIEDRVGLDGTPRVMWVDRKGRLLKAGVAGGIVLRISDEREVRARAEPLLRPAHRALIEP